MHLEIKRLAEELVKFHCLKFSKAKPHFHDFISLSEQQHAGKTFF